MLLSSCGSSNSGPTLTGIDINPISPTIAVGETQQFTCDRALLRWDNGKLDAQANWGSDDTTVATVQNLGTHPGLATGKSVGKANITVSFAQGSSTVNASTDLTVEK